MRSSILRGTLSLLTTVTAAACSYSSAYPTAVPHDSPPATAAFPTGLWTVSGGLSAISRLDNDQLLTSGVKSPATTLSARNLSLNALNSIAFDSAGTMWVGSRDDSLLAAFTNGNDVGTSTPSILIRSNNRSLAGPSAIAFDFDRAIWVASFSAGTIVRFDKSQLTKSGSPVPSVTLKGIRHPTGIAFDAVGAMWVTDDSANTVSSYTREQLLTSGNKVPAVVLSANGSSLVNPTGIAFDSFNNMWIANTGTQSVVAFRPPQRGASAAPVPFLTLAPTAMPIGNPTGLAFDQTGHLWVMSISGLLSEFTALDIAASGPAEPTLQMQISNHQLLWSIAFWPTPSGFPLH